MSAAGQEASGEHGAENCCMMLPDKLAGGINAPCLNYPLFSVFELKVLQDNRESIRRLVGSRQVAPGLGVTRSYSEP